MLSKSVSDANLYLDSVCGLCGALCHVAPQGASSKSSAKSVWRRRVRGSPSRRCFKERNRQPLCSRNIARVRLMEFSVTSIFSTS